jgi:hypothetical protein
MSFFCRPKLLALSPLPGRPSDFAISSCLFQRSWVIYKPHTATGDRAGELSYVFCSIGPASSSYVQFSWLSAAYIGTAYTSRIDPTHYTASLSTPYTYIHNARVSTILHYKGCPCRINIRACISCLDTPIRYATSI